MTGKAQILAIGDVHLGTACSGIPDEISSWGTDSARLTPAAALQAAVDFAIARQVDAILFAGDVVESTNARFEAMSSLKKNVRRLLDAGIKVIGVAGNHDVEALPRLAKLIDGFKLLGEGGCWEPIMLSRNGTPVAQIVGWSFGEKKVVHSPVAQLISAPPPSPPQAVPRIGLLHCDLGGGISSEYAPIKQSELDDTGFDAWLLGHIHKPSLEKLARSGGGFRPSGYLGSLVGLDPSETGPHGPWLLSTYGKEGGINLEHIPLAPLRWERLDVPIDGIGLEDVRDQLPAKAQELVRALAQDGLSPPQALGLRVRLVGSSGAYDDIRKWINAGKWKSDAVTRIDDTVVFFNRIDDAMDLHWDLEKIAKGNDPAALLARRLLLLQHDNEQSREFLDQARQRLGPIAKHNDWKPTQEHRSAIDPVSNDALRDVLMRSGKAALAEMLASRDAKAAS